MFILRSTNKGHTLLRDVFRLSERICLLKKFRSHFDKACFRVLFTDFFVGKNKGHALLRKAFRDSKEAHFGRGRSCGFCDACGCFLVF